MRRTVLLASGTALILGLLGAGMVFGSALVQPVFQAAGTPQVALEDDIGTCHVDDGATGGLNAHMLGPIAQALGISEAELLADLDAGKSVKDIAKARGYDDARLATALGGAMRDAMQQHVQDGLLSQAQVDEMLERMDRMGATHLADMLDGQMPADMMDGLDHGSMMGGQSHGSLKGNQDHGSMMGGQSHESMMGAQQPGTMMGSGAGDTEESSGAACHTENVARAQSF